MKTDGSFKQYLFDNYPADRFFVENGKSKGKREYYIVFKPCIDDDFKSGIYSAGICTPLWIRGAEQNGNGAFAGIQNGRV